MPRSSSFALAVLIAMLVIGVSGVAEVARAQTALRDELAEGIKLEERANELFYDGKVADAIQLTKRALEIWEKDLPPGHLEIAVALNNLAFYSMRQEGHPSLDTIEPLLQRALKIQEAALPDEAVQPEIALTLKNLADLYSAQRRLDEAVPLYQRSLSMRQAARIKEDTLIPKILGNLGEVYLRQKKFAEAEPLFKQALEMEQESHPADDPVVAMALDNLAYLYFDQNRLDDAEAMLKRVLAIRERTLPADHPALARTVRNLIGVYEARGNKAEAAHLRERFPKLDAK